jgi:asparagine synthetase B (glutamine-hydrolysing)
MSALSKNITEIMGAYVNDIRGRGEKFMTMLSGGVDSSTMQLLVNRSLPTEEKPQSISYIIDAKSFQFEVDYARTASELLHTQHTFFEIPMREYADRLVEAIGILAQPNATPVISNKFILARHLKDKYPSIEYLFNGLCSDCLFGVDFYKSLSFRYGKILHYVPGYYTLMRTSTVTSLPSVKGSHLTAALKLLADRDTWSSLFIPAQLTSPFNKLEMADIIDLHRRVFGDRALLNVLNYRENILAKYSKGRNRMEQIQDADTIDAGYESAIHNYVFYQSQRKKLIYFYLDQEVFQLVRAFDPRIRYLEGKRTKPLIKNILLESSLDAITNKKKGGSGMNHYDLHRMMKEGALKELVRSIDRPSFMNKRDFDELMNSPEGKYTGFLWDLLNWDIFQKQLKGRIIKAKS